MDCLLASLSGSRGDLLVRRWNFGLNSQNFLERLRVSRRPSRRHSWNHLRRSNLEVMAKEVVIPNQSAARHAVSSSISGEHLFSSGFLPEQHASNIGRAAAAMLPESA